MTSRFTPYELCLLADFLCDDIYDAIEYSCPVYYKNAASLLNNPSDPKTSYFANKWEVDKFKLASKLSSMNINDSQRLTLALINYWKSYYKHDIELNLEEWAENELWNW